MKGLGFWWLAIPHSRLKPFTSGCSEKMGITPEKGLGTRMGVDQFKPYYNRDLFFAIMVVDLIFSFVIIKCGLTEILWLDC